MACRTGGGCGIVVVSRGRGEDGPSLLGEDMTKLAADVRVVDADMHLTEAHDLWTKHEYIKPAIGGTMLFINNARVVVNVMLCGKSRRKVMGDNAAKLYRL